MKKVLVIAYYWPPAGGGGVQRWVKFVKYLREYGWEPIVYVPENASYPIEDKSLAKDVPENMIVLKKKIWEPYSFYAKLLGNKKDKKVSVGLISDKPQRKSFLKNLSLWVRGNWFIPDARKFWINPSIKYLTNYIKENGIETIITTGPPHSMHLIGLGLKKNTSVKWLADFRDPWVYMDNYIEDFKFTKKTLNKHLRLEKEVLTKADRVVTVTDQMVLDYNKIRIKKIDLITNGFDESDFAQAINPSDKFIIGHYGTLGKYRNPDILLKVLKDLCGEDDRFNSKLVLELIGPVDGEIFSEVEKNGLTSKLVRADYISHGEAIKKMIGASILLLLLDKNITMKGRMTGKIFEYLAARSPILGLGSLDSDPVKVLNETGAGKMVEYDDYEGLKSFVKDKFNAFDAGKSVKNDTDKIKKYSRRELTKNLVAVLDEI